MNKKDTGEMPVGSGWCITGTHDKCSSFYLKQEYNRGCICKCHVDKEVTVK